MKPSYKEILDRFTGDPGWLKKPFTIGEYSYATDSITIVRTPKTEEVDRFKFSTKESITRLFSDTPNMKSVVSVEELERIFKNVPLVDETEKTNKNCTECDGEGQVYWEYDSFQELFDCPVCNGFGKTDIMMPTGNKTLDDTASVKIGVSYFYLLLLLPIIEVAKELGEKEITFLLQTSPGEKVMIKMSNICFVTVPIRINHGLPENLWRN